MCDNARMPKGLDTRFDLICHGCGATAPLNTALSCNVCGEPRSLRSTARVSASHLRRAPKSMWHFAALLPAGSRRYIVSLGEGATPLVNAPQLSRRFGFGEIWLKNEMANPTGSFKDRQISVGLSHAREIGARVVAAVSSGNVACAVSAYAARAGMPAVLFMHGQAGAGKIAQAAVYGGTVIRIDSASPSAVFKLCLDACARWGWYHLSTAGMYEPYNVEGAKTIAYELYQQFRGCLPDWIVAPVGGGGLLGGIWRGFLDLQRLGLIEHLPRLAGVQAAGCAPLKKAIDAGAPFLETLRNPWPNPKTIAGGIADDIIFDGHTVLPAIRTTQGAAIAVKDAEIEAGLKILARSEGLLCELTSAVVIAALPYLPDAGPNSRICCILTGSGIKDLPYLTQRAPATPLIPPSLDALDQLLGERDRP